MGSIMFIDRVTIELIAGRGGDGVVAWRREKYIPKGGPGGGGGGGGGNVIVRVDNNFHSLESLRNKRIMAAGRGRGGGANECTGRSGEDCIITVPEGTTVFDAETREVIVDLTEAGQEFCLCKGGIGGRGNKSFATPRRRAPHFATVGTEGETRKVEFELKLIADVGLVGFPNAGKSTLISLLTAQDAKAAPYPFTTLHPNLGVFEDDIGERIQFADIPGIIAGASEDRGLGYKFLRHIERCKVLLFLLDASCIDGRDPASDFIALREELQAYNEEILNRPTIVLLNKTDTDDANDHVAYFKETCGHLVDPNFLFEGSALYGIGTSGVLEKVQEELKTLT